MKILRALITWISTSFLLFLLGAIVTWGEIWPFDPHLRNAFVGLQALVGLVSERDDTDSDVWMPSGQGEGPTGVLRHEPGAYDGYTLITVGQSAYLIDMAGEVLHAWSFPYGSLPSDERLRSKAPSEIQLYWKPARLLENGDLLVIIDLMGASPEGLALVRLDPSSRPRWAYHGSVHHDFDIDAEGWIYVLDQRITQDAVDALPALVPPLIDEGVVVLSPDGQREKRVALVEAFANSPFARMLDHTARESRWPWGDYLHSNNIDILSAEMAGHFDGMEPGQALLSFREINTIALLDVEAEQIVWALRGDWFAQHDPDFLPNGRLLMFDNLGDWLRGAGSRVIEIDPASGGIVWSYPGAGDPPLFSAYRGDQQRLPNGNTLINEFQRGRLREIAPDGRMVWEYRCPFQHTTHQDRRCRVMSAERYEADRITFTLNHGEVAPAATPP